MTIAHPFALITICSTPRSTGVRNGQRDVRNQRSSTVPSWISGEILRLANGVRTVRFKTTNEKIYTGLEDLSPCDVLGEPIPV